MTAYEIEGILPDGMVDALPQGTNLMISGPAMIGKRELAIRLLTAGYDEGEGILCVTTSKNATSLLDELESQIPTLDRERVAIVDCTGSDHQEVIKEIATEQVSTPGDLTGISISSAKLLQQFTRQDISEVRHGLVSVSTLIQFLDVNTVFKFLHIYTSRITDTQGLGVFTVDGESHDPQTLNTISSEFDGVLELREVETGEREIRLNGISDASRKWYSIS